MKPLALSAVICRLQVEAEVESPPGEAQRSRAKKSATYAAEAVSGAKPRSASRSRYGCWGQTAPSSVCR
jgi:hypothetical protein